MTRNPRRKSVVSFFVKRSWGIINRQDCVYLPRAHLGAQQHLGLDRRYVYNGAASLYMGVTKKWTDGLTPTLVLQQPADEELFQESW